MMGLLQKACETYDAFASLAGVYIEGQVPLAPVGHMAAAAQLEITLNGMGAFVTARMVDKQEPKIIIPVTEKSAARTSAPCAHPLCDQLQYVAPYDEKRHTLYLTGLSAWADSEYTHPKLGPILAYVKGGTILADLNIGGLIELTENGLPKEEKLLVRWVVNGLGEESGPCWTDRTLFDAFTRYYAAWKEREEKVLCMVTGEKDFPADQHLKGVVPIHGNAKLISANDSSNFTYRGRFGEPWQAETVGYTASQKAHNALRWIVANQGVRVAMPGDSPATAEGENAYTVYGGRTFLCWNPQGIKIPRLTGAMGRKDGGAAGGKLTPSAYRERLREALRGWKTDLPDTAGVVVAALDAATDGRLSVTYYSELRASDFLERLYRWDNTCCWENGNYGVQSPSIFQIVNFAYGTYRGTRFENDNDGVLRQQMQRLVACRIDGGRFPADIEKRLVKQASNPAKMNEKTYETLLFTACAVIQKYYSDRNREEWSMETNLDRADRSFQFGRLLAVLERTEQSYYWNMGGEDLDKQRETNAIRMMPAFCRHPFGTYEVLNKKLRIAYLPRMKSWQREQYKNLTDEIIGLLMECRGEELDSSLKDTYLLGYHLQRAAMRQKKADSIEPTGNTEKTEEE